MSRAARITVGSVVAGVLAFVALVAGAMAGASSFAGSGAFDGAWLFEGEARYVSAEVLDVDHDLGYTSVDVRYTTEDDEVVVTWVDWEHDDQMPVVGDRIDVVYDSADPEWSFAADDPAASGLGGGTGEPDGPGASENLTAQDAPEGTGVAQASGWVALGALAMLLLTVVVTVAVAVRAPAPARPASLPDDPFAWQPGHLPPHQQGHLPLVQAPYGSSTPASPAAYRGGPAASPQQGGGVPQGRPPQWQGPS